MRTGNAYSGLLSHQQRVPLSIVLFLLITVFLMFAWNGWEQYSVFKNTQSDVMQKSSWAAAGEVASFIELMQSNVKIFAESESELLKGVVSPGIDQNSLRELLSRRVNNSYPGAINSLIWDDAGRLVLDSNGTQADKPEVFQLPSIGNTRSEFAVKMLHNSEQEHFNIIVPWLSSSGKRFLFGISFPSDLLQPLLYKHQTSDYQLVLWRQNVPGFVEFASSDSELNLINDVFMDEFDMQRVGAAAAVGGTEWDVVSLHDSKLYSSKLKEILLSGITKYFLVLGVLLAGLYLYNAEAKRRFKENEKIHRNEERLKLALESTNDGVWELDFNNQDCYFNERWYEILGYKNLEHKDPFTIWSDLVHESDIEQTNNAFQAHINGVTEFYEREHRLLHKSGDWKWVHDRGRVLEWNEGGSPSRVIGTTADITKRKTAEYALRKNEDALNSFYSIVSVESASLQNQIQCLLVSGCQHLKMKCGILSYVEGDRYTVRQVHTSSSEYKILPGDKFDLGITYCQFTLNQRKPVGFAHANTTEIAEHPAYEALKLEAYLGVPVMLDGNKAYGTLNFTSIEPRANEFSDSEKYFVQLMAEWISNKLQKQIAEQREFEASKKLEVHMEHTPIASIEWDEDGRVIKWSKRAEEIFGWSENEVINLKPNAWPLMHPGQKENLNKLNTQFLSSNEVDNFSLELQNRTGDIHYTSWVVSKIKDLFSNKVSYIANIQDVSERVSVQQELMQSEARFHDLYENAPDMYLSINPLGIIQSLNVFCAESLGYGKDELLTTPYWNLIHQDDLRRARRHIKVVFDDQVNEFEMEIRMLTKSGEIINTHQRIRLIEAHHNSPRELRILSRDITQRATTQQERLDHIKVQRDELGREIRHRIKNNLQAIVGLLKVNLDTYPELRNVLVTSINQVDTISIVNNLMIDSNHRLVNLLQLVKQITEASSKLFSQEVSFNYDRGKIESIELWEEETVAVSLIISEIITNAMKHRSEFAIKPDGVQIKIKSVNEKIELHVLNEVNSESSEFNIEERSNAGGVGLGMVQSLMPPEGAELSYSHEGSYVHAVLTLYSPVLLYDQLTDVTILEAI